MARQEKSRIFAAGLAFIFGMFGAHKFYLEKGGQGMMFIFLLFMGINVLSFPITALLGFFDAFRLLIMSDEQFDATYNKGLKNNRRQQRSTRQRTRTNRSTSQRRTSSAAPARRKNKNNFSKSNPFKKSGIDKYKEFDIDGAIADFEQGLAISPGDVALHWNITCAYALQENKDKAFYHLEKAVQLGFNDFEKIQTHDDLAFLRIQPEYDGFKNAGYRMTGNRVRNSNEEPKSSNAPIKEEELTDDILLSQLNKLAELRKKGLLSEQEFVAERKKLLRR